MTRLLNAGVVACSALLFGAVANAQNTTCATKGRPEGKVLQGYWENWDNSAIHPGMGWVSISDPSMAEHGYNVYQAAFPTIKPDGTVLWADDMDSGVKVGTPQDMCDAKAAGATILMSIGGANAAVNLADSAVADKFVETIVPILKEYNFDGIDIDIESGLTGSGSMTELDPTQQNLIRIIDGVLDAMPDNFGLTMAPETAYVTGGAVSFNSIWGSYLPIIHKYMESGRLWWLNMQYYNGDNYDCKGSSYGTATVEGFVAQTDCLNEGLTVDGVTVKVPYDNQVPGLPAQKGAAGSGYMSTDLVGQAWDNYDGELKGIMTWSINWDGSLGWTFGDNMKSRVA